MLLLQRVSFESDTNTNPYPALQWCFPKHPPIGKTKWGQLYLGPTVMPLYNSYTWALPSCHYITVTLGPYRHATI